MNGSSRREPLSIAGCKIGFDSVAKLAPKDEARTSVAKLPPSKIIEVQVPGDPIFASEQPSECQRISPKIIAILARGKANRHGTPHGEQGRPRRCKA